MRPKNIEHTIALGERIKMLRKARNISQYEIAAKLGVSPQAVSRWELGLSQPESVKLPKLAKLLGTTIDEIFDDIE